MRTKRGAQMKTTRILLVFLLFLSLSSDWSLSTPSCGGLPHTESSPVCIKRLFERSAEAHGSIPVERLIESADDTVRPAYSSNRLCSSCGRQSVRRSSHVTSCYQETRIWTGIYTGTYIYAFPAGSRWDVYDWQSATVSQKVLDRTENTVRVSLVMTHYLDTSAPFPLDITQLPSEPLPYLEPNPWQQSDNPEIIALAEKLTTGCTKEYEAVGHILDWVRANIRYDGSRSLPTDAVSVYNNRSGVCAGFSNLAVALHRAAGIPARGVHGYCFLETHAWIEVFYTDQGWIQSDPQWKKNGAGGIRGDFPSGTEEVWYDENYDDQEILCAVSGPIVPEGPQFEERAELDDVLIPEWDRCSIHLHPSSTTFLAESDGALPQPRELIVQHNRGHPWSGDECFIFYEWRVDNTTDWLTVFPTSGLTYTLALVSVDPHGLPTARYSSVISFTLYDPYDDCTIRPYQENFTVTLVVADKLHRIYLPTLVKTLG